MITHVGSVSLFVADQERAKKFYTETLGFDLRTDAPLYPGSEARWIDVAPKGAQTGVILYLPDENWTHYQQVVGKSQALTFTVQDLAGTYAELVAKGVTFVQEPATEPWGSYAILQDSEGNLIIMSEGA